MVSVWFWIICDGSDGHLGIIGIPIRSSSYRGLVESFWRNEELLAGVDDVVKESFLHLGVG